MANNLLTRRNASGDLGHIPPQAIFRDVGKFDGDLRHDFMQRGSGLLAISSGRSVDSWLKTELSYKLSGSLLDFFAFGFEFFIVHLSRLIPREFPIRQFIHC